MAKRLNKDFSLLCKHLRALNIRAYMQRYGFSRCVCFSCGNACKELKRVGLECISIAPDGDLVAGRWWTQGEINNTFVGVFDATSGHLPMELMISIADGFKSAFNGVICAGKTYIVPTGSGETIFCLKMAFPDADFIAEYDNSNPATMREDGAPLSKVIETFFNVSVI